MISIEGQGVLNSPPFLQRTLSPRQHSSVNRLLASTLWLANCCFTSEYQCDIALNVDTVPIRQGHMATWLLEQEAEEVLMESTAQYWKPVWGLTSTSMSCTQ